MQQHLYIVCIGPQLYAVMDRDSAKVMKTGSFASCYDFIHLM